MYFKKLIAYDGYYNSEYKNKLLKFYKDLNDLNVKICSFENIDGRTLEIIEDKICIYSSDDLIINNNDNNNDNDLIINNELIINDNIYKYCIIL